MPSIKGAAAFSAAVRSMAITVSSTDQILPGGDREFFRDRAIGLPAGRADPTVERQPSTSAD
jgi:hypothetical protein